MIAEELAKYLQAKGHGTQNEDLFLGFQPAFPVCCVTVYDETAPVADESNALSVDLFGVQVLVRNSTYTGARDKILEIHKDLVGFGGGTFVDGGKLVHAVFISTTPASIGRDENGNSEWSAHYMVRVESSGDSYRS